MNAARGQFQDKQEVIGDEAALGPDFDRGEIHGGEGFPMGLEKRLPGTVAFSFGRRFDAVLPENVTDGRIGNGVAEVGQSALDAVVAPGEVLFRESEHEFPQFCGDRRTSGLVLSSRGVIPFLGDELPMPTQNGVGRDQRADFTEELASQRFSWDGQAASLVVREPQPFLAVQFFKDSILRPEVFDELLLLLGHPTGQNRDEQLPRLELAAHAGTSTPES